MKTMLKALTGAVMLMFLFAANLATATPTQATQAIAGVTALDDSVNWQPQGLLAYEEMVLASFYPSPPMVADFSAGPMTDVMVSAEQNKANLAPRFRLRLDGTWEEVETDIYGNEIDVDRDRTFGSA